MEKHHRVQLLDEALEAAVKLSRRYIPDRQLPDKAVSLWTLRAPEWLSASMRCPRKSMITGASSASEGSELEIIKQERGIAADTYAAHT